MGQRADGAGMDRRTFLRRAVLGGAGLALAGPFHGLACRPRAEPVRTPGYGPLADRGGIWLPEGFRHRILSRAGELMDDGRPTPGLFDGMAAFRGAGGATVLVRNHENRRRDGEIPVVVPEQLRWDPDPAFNGGCTRLELTPGRVRTFAVLGGTSTNCAGGPTPWGSWITCEETFADGVRPHGYAFEVDARAQGPVPAVPIRAAGRFAHEAVAWLDGVLYETEDRGDAALYRFLPSRTPRRAGDLAAAGGRLQALRVVGSPAADTSAAWPVGEAVRIDWVDLPVAEPPEDVLREVAHAAGAARFRRTEGAWSGQGRVWFDCTEGGRAGYGQIWELDPAAGTLTLIYESPGEASLTSPDNLVAIPGGDLLLCEDSDGPHLRGLTRDGGIYDFARAGENDSEFCGATFHAGTLYVNQQGRRTGKGAVTYAIRGPWRS